MRQLADDLWLLRGFPPYAINVYLIGDVLIDAATRRGGRRILKQLAGRTVSAHALTHAHPDHQGASKEVCEALGIPLWCHELDADAMEQGTIPDRAALAPDQPRDRRSSGWGRPTRSRGAFKKAT